MGKMALALWIFFEAGLLGLPAQQAPWETVRASTEARLREIVQANQGVVGFQAIDLKDGEELGWNPDWVFPQGSAIKIPILMELFRQAQEGLLSLEERLVVRHQDLVGGSGVLQHFSDGTSQLSLRDLAVLMIVLSDNTATNLLIDRVGMKEVNRTLGNLGLSRTLLQRKMMDEGARARGEENLSTPAEAAHLMRLLYEGRFVSPEVCRQILEILSLPKPGAIRSALPSNLRVAFKPGGIPGVSTEWALVELPERPYVLVIMASYQLQEQASQSMTAISRTFYDYFWRKGRASQYGTYVSPELLPRKP